MVRIVRRIRVATDFFKISNASEIWGEAVAGEALGGGGKVTA